MKVVRQLLIVFFFSFILIITTLSVERNFYLGGQRLIGKEEIFNFLSELLPNVYHIIKNKGFTVESLLIERKKDMNPNEFIVFGLFPYLTNSGWVILDKMEKSNTIIILPKNKTAS
jgi:hypothetical protein